VQLRGAEILSTLKASSALSCANAIERHLHDWLGSGDRDDPGSSFFSMGVLSDGSCLGVPEGIVFSLPFSRTERGDLQPVALPPLDPETQAQVDLTVRELLEEKEAAADFL
jgi:malate/lactate dehydrogenase